MGDVIRLQSHDKARAKVGGNAALRAAAQPIRLSSGKPYGAELLVRRDGGSADESAKLALSQLSGPEDWFNLDVFMLGQAARLARANPSLHVFVNLSIITVSNRRFRERYLQSAEVHAASLPPKRIVAEVNECFNASVRSLNALIGLFHEVQLTAALDDFHASAECWRKARAKWDYIKLDCARLAEEGAIACLRDLTGNSLAHQSPLLVAEAIETNASAKAMLHAGANLIQGYVAGCPQFLGEKNI